MNVSQLWICQKAIVIISIFWWSNINYVSWNYLIIYSDYFYLFYSQEDLDRLQMIETVLNDELANDDPGKVNEPGKG